MKLAIIGTRGIPEQYGGFEMNVEKTAGYLAQQGVDVTVYCRQKKELTSHNGVKLVYIKTIKLKNVATLWHTFISLLHACIRDYDLIHVYNVGNGPLLFIPKLFGKKVICSVDGMDWKRKKYNFIEKRLVLLCAKFASKFADKVIVDSRYVGKFYLDFFKTKTKYIPYGADIIKKSPSKKILKTLGVASQKYLLFVGRFVPEKNIPILIQAFKLAKLKNFKLVVVGQSDDVAYQQKITALKSKNIIMPGKIHGQNIKTLHKNAYAYITASELEGTSPALLEAMGSSTCVLVNSINENLETIAKSGLSYKFNDVADLSDKITYIVNNPNYKNKIGERCRKRIEKYYSWDKINKQYHKFILSFKK